MSTTIAVDLAKSVFEVAVSETPGHVTARHRLTRAQFHRFVATAPPATVLLEACGSAHYWGRTAVAAGHSVRLLPPHAVRDVHAGFVASLAPPRPPCGSRQAPRDPAGRSANGASNELRRVHHHDG